MALGLQLHLQCVGMGDPAFERIVQRHHKSGCAQRCVVRVRPMQPGVLGFIGGDAKNATFGRYQTHVHQAGNGVKLGFGIAVVPKANAPKKALEGLEIHAVDRIEQAMDVVRGL